MLTPDLGEKWNVFYCISVIFFYFMILGLFAYTALSQIPSQRRSDLESSGDVGGRTLRDVVNEGTARDASWYLRLFG